MNTTLPNRAAPIAERLRAACGKGEFRYGRDALLASPQCGVMLRLRHDGPEPYYRATICGRLEGNEADGIPWRVVSSGGEEIARGVTGGHGFRIPFDSRYARGEGEVCRLEFPVVEPATTLQTRREERVYSPSITLADAEDEAGDELPEGLTHGATPDRRWIAVREQFGPDDEPYDERYPYGVVLVQIVDRSANQQIALRLMPVGCNLDRTISDTKLPVSWFLRATPVLPPDCDVHFHSVIDATDVCVLPDAAGELDRLLGTVFVNANDELRKRIERLRKR